MMARLPLAHIHGGERTEGVIDDAVRHAITKMAHIHFVSAEPYGRRVIQLGEDPTRVHLVGAPGLDHLGRTRLLGRKALAHALGFELGSSYLLVTYHPVTLRRRPAAGTGALLKALDRFPDQRVIFTGVNADIGNDAVGRALVDFARASSDRVTLRASLGQRLYLSAMKHCAAVIGNSSSGLIEAPALRVPTVNIGNRQRGRLRAASVIDCGENPASIAAAIHRALDPAFRRAARKTVSPFGDGRASARMARNLAEVDLNGVRNKRFHDLPWQA
jgi:UDP-hydrolysing UDP-N-acetyl-D-glucosamine 2-epimerase